MATTNPEETMTDHELVDALRDALDNADDEGLFDGELLSGVSTSTFADDMVLTLNAGLVLRLRDGSEFQLTVVRSR